MPLLGEKYRYIDTCQEDTSEAPPTHTIKYGEASDGNFYIGEPIQVGGGDKKLGAEIYKPPNRQAALMKLLKIDRSVGFKNRQEYCDYIVTAANAYPDSGRKKARSQ